LCYSYQTGVYGRAYRDKKVVGVFVRFRAPLQRRTVWWPSGVMEAWCARKWCSLWRNIDNCRGVPPPVPPCQRHPPAQLSTLSRSLGLIVSMLAAPVSRPARALEAWHIGHCGKQQGEAASI
jgi:hypothetical protein